MVTTTLPNPQATAKWWIWMLPKSRLSKGKGSGHQVFYAPSNDEAGLEHLKQLQEHLAPQAICTRLMERHENWPHQVLIEKWSN